MAFSLQTNNLTGLATITQPGGVLATNANYITLYDYATQYQPELIPELHYANGKGNITGMLALLAGEKTAASDVVQHAEMNRLMNKLTNVAVAGNVFTSPTPHNLRPNMVIKISDGVKEIQAYVTVVTSTTVFTALNDKVGAYGFAGTVDIVADFSNRWDKGTKSFVKGRTWNPKFFKNYMQIIKERYDINESDMAHNIWLDTPDGPRWCNVELERTNTLFDNIVELTHFFGERAEDTAPSTLAGVTQGMKGIIQQVEQYGNVGNDYIQTVANLRDIALRIKEQGIDATEYSFFCNHTQMNYFNDICSLVSPAAVNAGSYGAFNNSKDMALKMDFTSVEVSGITFYFKPWRLLDDPTLLATGKFATTGVAYFGMPMGITTVQNEKEEKVSTPYLSIYNRVKGNVNRRRKVQIFGLGGTDQEVDAMTMLLTNESTNQVVGANAFFVGRRAAAYYA